MTPVARHPAVETQIAGVGQPVGDVVRRDAPGRPFDLGVQLRIPPDVVGIDRDADLGGRRRERSHQSFRLA